MQMLETTWRQAKIRVTEDFHNHSVEWQEDMTTSQKWLQACQEAFHTETLIILQPEWLSPSGSSLEGPSSLFEKYHFLLLKSIAASSRKVHGSTSDSKVHSTMMVGQY